MKIFNLDSPLMQVLNKVADLMWLNILALICCIPLVTIGASLTALHSVALKIVRNEEGYITRNYFKAFKQNFVQATLIWLLLLAVALVLFGDFYIIRNAGIDFPQFLQIAIMAVGILIIFAAIFVFPVQARFENKIIRTIKNAFVMSILQFPKTLLMVVIYLLPIILFMVSMNLIPIIFLFGLSVPVYLSAMLYNKFFLKLEAQVEEAAAAKDGAGQEEPEEEDDRIFKDELDESLITEKK